MPSHIRILVPLFLNFLHPHFFAIIVFQCQQELTSYRDEHYQKNVKKNDTYLFNLSCVIRSNSYKSLRCTKPLTYSTYYPSLIYLHSVPSSSYIKVVTLPQCYCQVLGPLHTPGPWLDSHVILHSFTYMIHLL